jgi:hypothetical protein
MFRLTTSAGAITLAALSSLAFAQAQEPVYFDRDICVKVRAGKDAEFSALTRDVLVKLTKPKIEAGMYSALLVARAVSPAGTSARCDYHFVFVSKGFPPEDRAGTATAADFKKAGIDMTPEAAAAKRAETGYLVSIDIWRTRVSVGEAVKGGYARLNYFKTKLGASLADWSQAETQWKPLAEELANQTPGSAWYQGTLVMPSGSNQPYNGLTVDSFPNWAALGKGIPVRATWNKVHPEIDFSAYIDRINAMADRPFVDVVQFVEVLRPANAASAAANR